MNSVLALFSAIGLGAMWLLFQRIKNAILQQDVTAQSTKVQQVDQAITNQQQVITDAKAQADQSLKEYEDAKTNSTNNSSESNS